MEVRAINIRDAKIVPDTRVYPVGNVSKEAGRKIMEDLESQGLIKPHVTATGRRLLSFIDAERLANAL